MRAGGKAIVGLHEDSSTGNAGGGTALEAFEEALQLDGFLDELFSQQAAALEPGSPSAE